MNRVDLIGALARGYCSKENEKKVMDPTLIEAMADEVGKLPQDPYLGCATTGELIDEIRARVEVDGMLGYTTVNGEKYCYDLAQENKITQPSQEE